jgi:polygalacturonase
MLLAAATVAVARLLLVLAAAAREQTAAASHVGHGADTGGWRELIDSGVVRVRVPVRSCDPRAHGAVADGQTDDTRAIQASLDECGREGGGTVTLSCRSSSGSSSSSSSCVFAAFPLRITGNHTELRIESSATLRFSSARNDSRWQGVAAAVMGSGIHDVAVTGGGTIDGNGSLWWTECAGHSLNATGWSTCGRPGLFTLNPVHNVLISGPRFLNSPCHNIVRAPAPPPPPRARGPTAEVGQ